MPHKELDDLCNLIGYLQVIETSFCCMSYDMILIICTSYISVARQ